MRIQIFKWGGGGSDGNVIGLTPKIINLGVKQFSINFFQLINSAKVATCADVGLYMSSL